MSEQKPITPVEKEKKVVVPTVTLAFEPGEEDYFNLPTLQNFTNKLVKELYSKENEDNRAIQRIISTGQFVGPFATDEKRANTYKLIAKMFYAGFLNKDEKSIKLGKFRESFDKSLTDWEKTNLQAVFEKIFSPISDQIEKTGRQSLSFKGFGTFAPKAMPSKEVVKVFSDTIESKRSKRDDIPSWDPEKVAVIEKQIPKLQKTLISFAQAMEELGMGGFFNKDLQNVNLFCRFFGQKLIETFYDETIINKKTGKLDVKKAGKDIDSSYMINIYLALLDRGIIKEDVFDTDWGDGELSINRGELGRQVKVFIWKQRVERLKKLIEKHKSDPAIIAQLEGELRAMNSKPERSMAESFGEKEEYKDGEYYSTFVEAVSGRIRANVANLPIEVSTLEVELGKLSLKEDERVKALEEEVREGEIREKLQKYKSVLDEKEKIFSAKASTSELKKKRTRAELLKVITDKAKDLSAKSKSAPIEKGAINSWLDGLMEQVGEQEDQGPKLNFKTAEAIVSEYKAGKELDGKEVGELVALIQNEISSLEFYLTDLETDIRTNELWKHKSIMQFQGMVFKAKEYIQKLENLRDSLFESISKKDNKVEKNEKEEAAKKRVFSILGTLTINALKETLGMEELKKNQSVVLYVKVFNMLKADMTFEQILEKLAEDGDIKK